MPFHREPPEVVKNLRDEQLKHVLDLHEITAERTRVAGAEDSDEEVVAEIDEKIVTKMDAIRRCRENLRGAEAMWREEQRKGQ